MIGVCLVQANFDELMLLLGCRQHCSGTINSSADIRVQDRW